MPSCSLRLKKKIIHVLSCRNEGIKFNFFFLHPCLVYGNKMLGRYHLSKRIWITDHAVFDKSAHYQPYIMEWEQWRGWEKSKVYRHLVLKTVCNSLVVIYSNILSVDRKLFDNSSDNQFSHILGNKSQIFLASQGESLLLSSVLYHHILPK